MDPHHNFSGTQYYDTGGWLDRSHDQSQSARDFPDDQSFDGQLGFTTASHDQNFHAQSSGGQSHSLDFTQESRNFQQGQIDLFRSPVRPQQTPSIPTPTSYQMEAPVPGTLYHQASSGPGGREGLMEGAVSSLISQTFISVLILF
jgi:hypothetical protein